MIREPVHSANDESNQRICVGVIVGAHGVRGLVKVKSFTATPEDLGAYGPLTDLTGSRVFDLEITGRAKGSVLCRIKGVNDRSAVDALKGQRLYVNRNALPCPDHEEEFYHSDLLGLPVFFPDGTKVGTVGALYDFGAGDVLEIRGDTGGAAMIPFTRKTVPTVDIASGRIVVNPAPGLLEAPVAPAADSRDQPPRGKKKPPIRDNESVIRTDEWPDEDWH